MDKSNPRIGTIFYFIRPYPKYILGIFVLILLSAVFEGLGVIALFGLLGTILNSEAAQATNYFLAIFLKIAELIPIRDEVITVSILIVVVTIIKSLLIFARQVFTSYAGFKIWHNVQEKIFEKYIDADYQYFLDHKQGQLIFWAYSAPSNMGALLQYVGETMALIIQVVVISFLLFSISVPMSLAVFLFGGVYYFSTNFVAKRISYFLGKGRTEACEKQNMLLAELISGIKQIKVFLSERKWLREYTAAMRDYFKLAFKDRVWHEIPTNIVEIFAIVMFCILTIALKRFYPRTFTSHLSMLGTFAYGFYRLMPSLKKIGTFAMGILGNLSIVEVLHSMMTEETKKIQDGDIDLEKFRTAIVFKDVNFSYPGRGKTLDAINFEIQKGKTIAVVGPSGSGKSTIVNLLLRMFVPDNGKIMIDGIDLNNIRLSSWLSKIGYVSQETFIFNASIEDNIIFGRTYDKERVIKVSRLANAHDFIESFPQGYKTVVGDKGLKLSGGERQRIAIARAIYNNPEILILDEATSALDNVSEAKVQEAIRKVISDRTVILVAHRFSSIVGADWVIVIDQGRIVEQGSHETLSMKKEGYWRLYKDYTKETADLAAEAKRSP